MRFSMIDIVLPACLGFASALSHAAPAPVRTHDVAPRVELQTRVEAVPVSTHRQDSAARSVPTAQTPRPTATDPATEDSGRGSYGTMVATLVLMGAIAARRYKAGKH